MICRDTVPSVPQKHAQRAMTLVELMIAVTVGMLLLAVVAVLYIFATRSFLALGNYDVLNQESVIALDTMSRDMRQARALRAFTTNQLTFEDYDGSRLVYVWDPAPNVLTLSRIKGAESKVLLRQCDYLNFAVYQRNPSNDFDFYPATTPALAKVVDVSWRCSRQILKRKINTETAQSATIVLRN